MAPEFWCQTTPTEFWCHDISGAKLHFADVAPLLEFGTKSLAPRLPVIEQLMARSGMDLKMAKTGYHSHSLEAQVAAMANADNPNRHWNPRKSVQKEKHTPDHT
ncbi:hypothetical protein Tco_0097028 [Tanacetum coccineum]